MSWDPHQYDRFASPRLQPAIDLLAGIPDMLAEIVVDLGCGSGAALPILGERFPDAQLIGAERDAAMLETSKNLAAENGIPVDLIQSDIETWQPESAVDVIFSNAVLHWLPDHRNLFPRLMSYLKPGGCLAVQVPNMWQQPVHLLMREVAGEPRWRDRALPACQIEPVMAPQAYEDILSPFSETRRVWETTYPHRLHGDDAVFEWISGSSLKPVLDALDPDEREAFEEQYKAALRGAYPADEDGTTPYPMQRLFIVATAPDIDVQAN